MPCHCLCQQAPARRGVTPRSHQQGKPHAVVVRARRKRRKGKKAVEMCHLRPSKGRSAPGHAICGGPGTWTRSTDLQLSDRTCDQSGQPVYFSWILGQRLRRTEPWPSAHPPSCSSRPRRVPRPALVSCDAEPSSPCWARCAVVRSRHSWRRSHSAYSRMNIAASSWTITGLTVGRPPPGTGRFSRQRFQVSDQPRETLCSCCTKKPAAAP